VPTAVFAAAEDWGQSERPADGALVDRIDRASRELAAAMLARQPAAPADPFAAPTPFEDLLGLRPGDGRV
jgi:FMN reductase